MSGGYYKIIRHNIYTESIIKVGKYEKDTDIEKIISESKKMMNVSGNKYSINIITNNWNEKYY